jgi:hypothetical protein
MEGPNGEFYLKKFKSQIEFSFLCIEGDKVYETKTALDKFGNKLEILFSEIGDPNIEVGPFNVHKKHNKYCFSNDYTKIIYNFAFLLGNCRIVTDYGKKYVLRDCLSLDILAEYDYPHFDHIWPDHMLYQYMSTYKTLIINTTNNDDMLINYTRDEISYITNDDVSVLIDDNFYTKDGKIPRSNGNLVIPKGNLHYEYKSDSQLTYTKIIKYNGEYKDDGPTITWAKSFYYPAKIIDSIGPYIIVTDDSVADKKLRLIGNAVGHNVFII